MTNVDIHNRKSAILWKDSWNSDIKQDLYPHLHSFAKNQKLAIQKAVEANSENIYDMFHLLLSTVAHEELHNLEQGLLDSNIIADDDIWSFNWGNNFSTKKVYRELIGNHPTSNCITTLWKAYNIPRHTFFAWLLLHGRLNTKEMMKHKHFYVEFSDCILCDACPEETNMHFF
jgi:hypothetical protein